MKQLAWLNIYFIFKSSRIYGWWAVIIVIVISLLDLLGWKYNIAFLKSVLIQWTPMKMVTACCFLASSASLAISNPVRKQISGQVYFIGFGNSSHYHRNSKSHLLYQ